MIVRTPLLRRLVVSTLAFTATATLRAAEPGTPAAEAPAAPETVVAPTDQTPSANAPEATPEDVAALHAVAQSLWDQFMPESVKEEYELISREDLQALLIGVKDAGRQSDLAAFADHAPETRAAINGILALPGFNDYAGWLRNQLEDMETARVAVAPTPLVTPPPAHPGVPLYDLWLQRIAKRPRPARADEFLPDIRAAFLAEGIPEELVWLAETESSFDPRARSPVGARGLFQLMPETARSLGLSLFPLDQRTHPQASARAAAAYLRKLYGRFGDWPLVLAAYNAGEGRVGRTLKAREARDFAGIADHLPAETQLYVPKVLATVRVRSGVEPAGLAGPKPLPTSR